MLSVFTTGCSVLALVASRLASIILFFDTRLAELRLTLELRGPVINTSSVLSAGVPNTSDALRFTPAVGVTVVDVLSLSLLSHRFVNHSFNSS